jgi:hypothetical protein
MGRLFPYILLILIVIGLVVAVPMLILQPERHRTEITQMLTQKLGHSVVIGKMDSGLFPPALRLHDVTVFKTTENPLLQADEIDATPDWVQLLHLAFVPRQITLQHPVFWIRRLANGTWEGAGELVQSPAIDGNASWPLRMLQVHAGECHWVDTVTTQDMSLKSLEGAFHFDQSIANFSGTTVGLAAPLGFTFEAKGHFGRSMQWTGDAHFTDEGRTWNLHLDDQNGKFDTTGESSLWKWDAFNSLVKFYNRSTSGVPGGAAIMMQDWKTHFTVDAESTTFYHSAGIGGGLTEIKGDVSSSSSGPVTHVSGAFQNAPVALFASGMESLSSMEGKVTGITRFQLTLSTEPWSSFSGQGSIEIKDGRYMFPQNSLKSLARAHTTKYLDRKFPDFETKGLAFQKFRTHWMAEKGMVSFSDAMIDAGDVKASLAGKLDGARHGMDGYIRLQIHESSHDLIKEIPPHYVYGAPNHESIQPIYGHLQGTWDEWLLRAAPSSKIPAYVQSQLRTSINTP